MGCYSPTGCYGAQGCYMRKIEYVQDHPGTFGTKGAFCYIDGNLLFDRMINWDEALDRAQWYQDFHKNHKVIAVIVSIPITTVRYILKTALAPVISVVCMVTFPLIAACGTAKRPYYYAAAWAAWEVVKYGVVFVILYYAIPFPISVYILAAYQGLGLIAAIFKGMATPTDKKREFLCQATMNSCKETGGCLTTIFSDTVKDVQKEVGKVAKGGVNAVTRDIVGDPNARRNDDIKDF